MAALVSWVNARRLVSFLEGAFPSRKVVRHTPSPTRLYFQPMADTNQPFTQSTVLFLGRLPCNKTTCLSQHSWQEDPDLCPFLVRHIVVGILTVRLLYFIHCRAGIKSRGADG